MLIELGLLSAALTPASACLDGTVNVISVAKGCIFNAIGHTCDA